MAGCARPRARDFACFGDSDDVERDDDGRLAARPRGSSAPLAAQASSPANSSDTMSSAASPNGPHSNPFWTVAVRKRVAGAERSAEFIEDAGFGLGNSSGFVASYGMPSMRDDSTP